jgi:hypothetical protein
LQRYMKKLNFHTVVKNYKSRFPAASFGKR